MIIVFIYLYPSLGLGKKLKSYATLPHYLSFLCYWEGVKFMENIHVILQKWKFWSISQTHWGSKQVHCKDLWSESTLWDVLKFLLGLRCKSFPPFPKKGTKFCTSISVHDPTQRTHSKIHETHEFPACPHPESHKF